MASPPTNTLTDTTAPPVPSRVGPFVLQAPVGRGGMGEVWRGVHAGTGQAAAVKLVPARDPSFGAAFRNEVRAAAALGHPNVVRIYDFGTSDDGVRSRGGLHWLAMELADGSLDPARGRTAWETLAGWLRDVLDGLGHAHARRVVHRDVKPANVLLVGGRAKLGDFGIARPREGPDAEAAGTPAYMAPEQAWGQARDIGPWTDLYAFGCMAWALVTGDPPPRGQWLPRLRPAVPVPADTEAWLRALIVRDPARRPLFAADARAGLDALGPAREGEHVVVSVAAASETLRLDAAVANPVEGAAEPTFDPEEPPARSLPRAAFPAFPGEDPEPAPWSGSTGLALYGLRTLPVVGRVDERRRLWNALVEVERSGTAGVVQLRGPAGFGKTRLLEWLCERAHETGAAVVMRATYGAIPGPQDGLAPMVARWLRTTDLAPDEARARAGRLFPTADAQDLTELGRLAPRARFAALSRLVASVGRPVVIAVDDAHWGAEALQLAAKLDHVPALVVLALREEALAERPIEAELAAALRGPRIDVGPLPPEDRPRLLRELLGLDGAVAAQVEGRTAGNPLFAVQLVGDWVQRGVLEPGEIGWRLRPGAVAELPDDLHTVWITRVEQVLDGADGRALELAAVLGQEVDPREWRRACEEAGFPAEPELVERLLASRLARRAGPGWAFVHGMLREALERRAKEAGRLAGHHRACAAVCSPDDPARLGRHLLAAGEPVAAAGPLVQGAHRLRIVGDFRAASALLLALEERLADLPPDADRIAAWIELSRCLVPVNALDAAQTWVTRAAAAARAEGDNGLEAYALRILASIAQTRGRYTDSLALFRQSLALAEQAGDLKKVAAALRGIGTTEVRQGRSEASVEAWRRALTYDAILGDEAAIAHCHRGLAVTLRAQGEPEAATAALHAALYANEKLGDLFTQANIHNELAEMARMRGELDEAEQGYARALALFERTGAGTVIVRTNLALTRVLRRDWASARAALTVAIRDADRHGLRPVSCPALLALAVCAAATGDVAEARFALGEARLRIEQTGFVDVDNEVMARLLAEVTDDPDLAAEGLDMAERQRAAREGRRA